MIRGFVTPSQCRAARALLGWSQVDLSRHTALPRATVVQFEGGHTLPLRSVLVLQMTVEDVGVEFIEDGVALHPSSGSGVGGRALHRGAVPRRRLVS